MSDPTNLLNTLNPSQPQGAVDAELVKVGKKRDKTSGEYLFDATTYAGFALMGNEATATLIVNGGKDAMKGAVPLHTQPLSSLGTADKARALVARGFNALDNGLAKLNPSGSMKYFARESAQAPSRFTYILFAIIGGFTMVPFIKALEDNKGRLVRFADRILHGSKAETDPEMVKAHQEMDEAPQQSWGSLMKGRALTVGAAYAVDTTINWDQGLSAKLLKNTPLKEYSSMEAISNKAAGWMSKHLSQWRKLTPEAAATQTKTLNTALGLLTLSAALTALFYGSSKLFASRRDEREERREEKHERQALKAEQTTAAPVVAHASHKHARDEAEPSLTVSSAQLQERLQASPQLQEGLHA